MKNRHGCAAFCEFLSEENQRLCVLRCRCSEIAFAEQELVESNSPNVNGVVPNVHGDGSIKIQLPQPNLRVFGKLPEGAWAGMPMNFRLTHENPPVAGTYRYIVASGTTAQKPPCGRLLESSLLAFDRMQDSEIGTTMEPSPAFIFVSRRLTHNGTRTGNLRSSYSLVGIMLRRPWRLPERPYESDRKQNLRRTCTR